MNEDDIADKIGKIVEEKIGKEAKYNYNNDSSEAWKKFQADKKAYHSKYNIEYQRVKKEFKLTRTDIYRYSIIYTSNLNEVDKNVEKRVKKPTELNHIKTSLIGYIKYVLNFAIM